MKNHFALVALMLVLSGCKSTSNLDVVTGFELDRYLGTWHEVARYDHRFERNMSNVSATYSRNDNGTVRVLNRGFKDDKQEWDDIEGVAKLKGDDDQGWLKVSFFKPFYASYKIIHLNEAYTEAIVTGPSYGYLWILTRKPDVPQENLDRLLELAEGFGFERSEIIIVDQSKYIQSTP
ncbi:Outer membrane lipoprotein Blc [Pontiella desulfatans]|uniref:Outer membrane lipoprotein Blc n=1 Tax=Pontiella desulfatans TaxID=2750659 RepID=A0A6C2TVL6_PONDE|nr:lipocalin family protein [Pontiella desulfatans]VGO11587.1 Outer membrane lipoprotein Blc [Pontiella desulfatans]